VSCGLVLDISTTGNAMKAILLQRQRRGIEELQRMKEGESGSCKL